MLKFIIFLGSSLLSNSAEISGDIMPGGQLTNGCLVGAGYSWCESSQNCIRQWITPCSDHYKDCSDCLKKQRDGENIACPVDCETTVVTDCLVDSDCDNTHFCRLYTMNVDGPKECVPLSIDGESCGGYTLPSQQSRCDPSLECANTGGPMIADAPGRCMRPCDSGSSRDSYGDCVYDIASPIISPLPPPSTQSCPDVMCMMYCENDFQKDANGCDMCVCNEIHNPECPIPYSDCNEKVCPKVTEITHCSMGGIPDYTTYQLSLIIKDKDIENIYALFGSNVDGHLMNIPGADQIKDLGTSNIGGISDNLIAINPDLEYDSWLTVGITDGNPNNRLATIGIDFESWAIDSPLSIGDGAVFLMDPNEVTLNDGELIVGQLTIPSSRYEEAVINVQGKLKDGSSWIQYEIIFTLNSPIIDTNSVPNDCEVWFDGCNTCQVNNGILGSCTRMMCFREETPSCVRYLTGH